MTTVTVNGVTYRSHLSHPFFVLWNIYMGSTDKLWGVERALAEAAPSDSIYRIHEGGYQSISGLRSDRISEMVTEALVRGYIVPIQSAEECGYNAEQESASNDDDNRRTNYGAY